MLLELFLFIVIWRFVREAVVGLWGGLLLRRLGRRLGRRG